MRVFLAFVPFVMTRTYVTPPVKENTGYTKTMRDEPTLTTSRRRLEKTGMTFCKTGNDCKEREVCMDLDNGKFGICVTESFFY